MTLEELQEKVVELEDKVKDLKATNETLTETNKQQETKITSLQEVNQKLFIRVTSSKNDDDKQEEEYTPTLVTKEYYDTLTDSEKETIRDLEEDLQ